jgi:outer membrane protein assembly factor BamE (lipoprotein component of BamABCDE complex)
MGFAAPTWSLVAAVAAGAVLLAGCQPIVHAHGHIPDAEAVASLEPGVATRDEVLDQFGSPSAVNAFGPETWYYIYARTETTVFLEPDLTDQQVVAIAFDGDGTVKEVKQYGLEDRQAIEPVSRTTPTHGKQLGLLQQLLGNVGRFNTDAPY